MKLNELLYEGMEFNACTLETKDDGTKMYSPHGMRETEVDCYGCEGMAGKIEGYKCHWCKNTGKTKDWECDSPEMQVSNANGMAIIRDIIGQEPDYAGSIPPEKYPALRQKLIKMINVDKERESMYKQTTDQQGQMRVKQQGDVTTIGRGARMIDVGRSDEQILSYAQRLLEIIEYAMKNDLVVTWA